MARVGPAGAGAWRRRSSRCRCWSPCSSSAPALGGGVRARPQRSRRAAGHGAGPGGRAHRGRRRPTVRRGGPGRRPDGARSSRTPSACAPSTGTDFVVVMSPRRHPLHPPRPAPDRPAVHRPHRRRPAGGDGRPRTTPGTLGPSVRAVVPVERRRRRVVAPGLGRHPHGGGRAGGARAAADRSCWPVGARRGARRASAPGWSAARLRRQTHGLGAPQLQRDVRVLRRRAARGPRGPAAGRRDGRVRLVNDEAARLLGLADDAVGRPVAELGLPPAARRGARSRATPAADELHVAVGPGAGAQPRPGPLAGARARHRGRPCATAPTCRP